MKNEVSNNNVTDRDIKISLIILIFSLVFVGVFSTYAFFVGQLGQNSNQSVSVQAGKMELIFADGNNGFNRELEFGESAEKIFTIENKGDINLFVNLIWKNLVNTYLEESLTYTLSYSESEKGIYTDIITDKRVPRSETATDIVLANYISVPSKTKYYYKLTITLNNLVDVDQTADLNAMFSTEFNIEQVSDNSSFQIDQKLVKQDLSYQDSLATISNPDRGWYIPLPVPLEGVTYDMQSQCLEAKKKNISILHLRVDIGSLSGNVNSDGIDKDFSNEQIQSLNSVLDIIRKNNLSVILRFAYDFGGNTGKEPKSFDTIKKHIQQLSTFLDTNKDIISTVEAGFLGPWGEMHSAGQYQYDNYYKELIETLLKYIPSEIIINVRKPYFYKLVTGALDHSEQRLGVFNDGYLGSVSDLGTFDNGISRNDFVDWMKVQGQYTLYGGEATKSGNSEDEKYSDSAFAITEMPKTHTSYLNSLFNLDVINKWESQYYSLLNDEYDGQTAHKYITDHLGYRMVLRNSLISDSVEKGAICGVNLEIENVGFANIVIPQKISVILRKGYEYYEATLNVNLNDIQSGSKKNIKFYFYVPSDIEAGDWEVYLKSARANSSNYAIQFANPDIWNNSLLANYIGKVNIKNSVIEEGVRIKQAFSPTSSEGNKETLSKPTVPVKINFNIESGQSYYAVENHHITVGTTIDFKDSNVLNDLGIKIPSGYKFLYAQCFAITNSWAGYDQIIIPDENAENAASSYEIHVYIGSQ